MENETLLNALGSAIQCLRKHRDYERIKSIYECLKNDNFDITGTGGSEAEQYLRMWLIYSFTAAQCNSTDKDIRNYAKEVINKIRGTKKNYEDMIFNIIKL